MAAQFLWQIANAHARSLAYSNLKPATALGGI
jgi:hypothetical protein